MSIRGMLNLTTVQIGRKTQSVDGMGGASATTAYTTLPRAAIWQAGSNNALLSDKIARNSTHVLVYETGDYTANTLDDLVSYDSETYRVTGRPDDVKHLGRVTVVGLELVE